MTTTAAEIGACCAVTYAHPAVGFLLGDSLHPGGLELTSRLAERLRLSETDSVLDAGCGPGTSAVHLAETIGCSVTGVTLEESGPAEMESRANLIGVAGRVRAVTGDITDVDLPRGRFDAVIAECVVSILPEKSRPLEHVGELLCPGGRLGLTDVTVDGKLPSDLNGLFATAGCVGGALSLHAYGDLLDQAGFVVDETRVLPDVALDFVDGIRGRLMLAEIAIKLGKLPVDRGVLETAKTYLGRARELVVDGMIGYGMVIAHRPD